VSDGDRSSGWADIESVDMVLRSYLLSPASEPQLTTPDEVQEAIRGLKLGKAPSPNDLANRALKPLPKRTVSFLALSSTLFSALTIFPNVEAHTNDLYP